MPDSETSRAPGFSNLAWAWRYAIAIAAVVVAIGLHLALMPVLGNRLLLVVFVPAVLIARGLGGIGPGLLAPGVGPEAGPGGEPPATHAFQAATAVAA